MALVGTAHGALHCVTGHSAGAAARGEASDVLEEIVVTATLRSTSVAELPQSVTVLDAQTLAAAGVQHFEDVLGLIPDLNWAAGTSRPRFFQLRGIGEVEQYQGAPNPSVGFLIDDIDFSGVGMPATLFDTRQIEVLRGPQGTTYGANALARPHQRADRRSRHRLRAATAKLTGADLRHARRGAVHRRWLRRRRGGLAPGRAAVSRATAFATTPIWIENATNGYDEGTLRGKLRWQIDDALQADLTLMHVNIDNGYDAWSIYNTYTTYSNQPGRDAQLSNGFALRLSDAHRGVSGIAQRHQRGEFHHHLFVRRRLGQRYVLVATTATRPTIIFKATIAIGVRSPRTCG